MTHDDDARVADLIGRLGDGDTKDLFRRLLERGMQDLIDAELTTAIGAEPHERTESRVTQRQLGVGTESLRNWVREAEADSGQRLGTTREDKTRIAALEKENREPRRANEMAGSGGGRNDLCVGL
jgi:hypothetical protein